MLFTPLRIQTCYYIMNNNVSQNKKINLIIRISYHFTEVNWLPILLLYKIYFYQNRWVIWSRANASHFSWLSFGYRRYLLKNNTAESKGPKRKDDSKINIFKKFSSFRKISKILAFVGATKFSSFTIRIRDAFDLDAFLILTDSGSDTVCISGTFDTLASVIFADKSSRTKFSVAVRTYFALNLKIGWFSETLWKIILENNLIFQMNLTCLHLFSLHWPLVIFLSSSGQWSWEEHSTSSHFRFLHRSLSPQWEFVRHSCFTHWLEVHVQRPSEGNLRFFENKDVEKKTFIYDI